MTLASTAGHVAVQSRYPIALQLHEVKQPPLELPPHPEFGGHGAPCVQPVGVGTGAGQLFEQTKCPVESHMHETPHWFDPTGTAVPQPSPCEHGAPGEHPGGGLGGTGWGPMVVPGQISVTQFPLMMA
jgi:hypothetical protein